jgi:hypothetical protein
MEFVNEHDTYPIFFLCVFLPFGHGAAIDKGTLISLVCMQCEFLHNIQHIEIHDFANIDLEHHFGGGHQGWGGQVKYHPVTTIFTQLN